jgi:arylsulfatase A-like enzyme
MDLDLMRNLRSTATRRRFLAAALGAAAGAAAAPPSPRKPNILLVLMDDLGYSSLSCYGNQQVPTPNLDRLASQGIRFTDAYVTPQCTPTRATLLTGQYTAVNRMWHVIPPYHYPGARIAEPVCRAGLDRGAFTLAKGMQQAGYATACIGKWHLTTNDDGNYGGLQPEAARFYGFDTVATPPKSAREFSTGDKAVGRFTDEAIAFIRANRERPWFCYLAHHSIHGVVSAPDALIRKYRDQGFPAEGLNNATYLAAIEHFDTEVGRLVKAVDQLGLASSTLVFSSAITAVSTVPGSPTLPR